jgi:hypothetical protein
MQLQELKMVFNLGELSHAGSLICRYALAKQARDMS